jgi:hypothetical protein
MLCSLKRRVRLYRRTDAGGVAEISRWCKPPVSDSKYDQPRQGRQNGDARFPPPLPGLVFLFGTDPVVGTTGCIPSSLRDCSHRRALQELIGIYIHRRNDVFRQGKFVECFAHETAEAHDRFAPHQEVEAELALQFLERSG